MSGTLAALTAQQIVTTGFQAWQPWTPSQPDTGGPPFLPAAGTALAIQGNSRILWQATIQTAWIPPDPQPTLPVLLHKVVTRSGPPVPPAPTPGNQATPPGHVSAYGATAMYAVPAVGISGRVGAIVPAAGLASVIAVGGTAVAIVVGPCNGGYITNPATAAAQGIVTAENCYIDMVNQPGSSDATASGTTVLLTPGQTFTIPALATGVIIYANAATSGHALTVVTW